MTHGHLWRYAGVALAFLTAACNSDLLDNPFGLRCDHGRTPPCAGGFVCVDDICVHPSTALDGGPWQNTAALRPSGSHGDDEASREAGHGDAAGTTTTSSATDATSAFEQTLVVEGNGVDTAAADAGDAGSTESCDVDGDAAANSDIDRSPDDTSDAEGTLASYEPGPRTDTPNGDTTGPSTTGPSETPTTPPATSTTQPNDTPTSDDDEPTGPAPCLVSCVAPQHGSAVCEGNVCTIRCEGDRIECDGRCVNTDDDIEHCGTCDEVGDAVEAGAARCDDGNCGIACDPGLTLCDGACVDTKTSVRNCGDCGAACQTGEVCASGECTLNCASGTEECAGACVDLASSPAHCGACHAACSAPANAQAVCVGSTCDFVCRDDFEECSGSCVDTQTDVNHCGGCGTRCESHDGSPRCDRGTCKADCRSGENYCDGTCVDLMEDPENCGECGNDCLLGICIEGECLLVL